MRNFDLLSNLISKANRYENLCYIYALGIILGIIIIIRLPRWWVGET